MSSLKKGHLSSLLFCSLNLYRYILDVLCARHRIFNLSRSVESTKRRHLPVSKRLNVLNPLTLWIWTSKLRVETVMINTPEFVQCSGGTRNHRDIHSTPQQWVECHYHTHWLHLEGRRSFREVRSSPGL